MSRISLNNLAQIEYHGTAESTQSCIDAVVRLMAFGEQITEARLLTNSGFHAFLLVINERNYLAVKKGFSSGYPGQGPSGLSTILQLLLRHQVEVDEYEVSREILSRIDLACLYQSDLDFLLSTPPIRPMKLRDYILNVESIGSFDDEALQNVFPPTIPFGLIDHRLIDLAIKFDKNPDSSILTAYRRLEGLIRERTGIVGLSGSKLFSQAFLGEEPPLIWPNCDANEQKGRGSLFTSTFMAFRNKRAHKELEKNFRDEVREFLMLNELFILESQSKLNPRS